MSDWSDLNNATEFMPIPEKNLEAVRHRARSLARRRLLLMVVGPAVLASASLSVIMFSQPGADTDSPFQPGPAASSPADQTKKSDGSGTRNRSRFPKASLPQREPRGYILSDFRVDYAKKRNGTKDERYAKLGFHQRWAEDIFPGPRECVFEVYNNRDRVVGDYEAKGLMSMRPTSNVTVTVPIHGFPVTGAGICFGRRLDAPGSGTFRVLNVRLGPSTLRAARVIFDWEWTGTGPPPEQECFVSFYDEKDHRLYTGVFTIGTHSKHGENLWWRFRPRPRLRDEATSVDVVCENFT